MTLVKPRSPGTRAGEQFTELDRDRREARRRGMSRCGRWRRPQAYYQLVAARSKMSRATTGKRASAHAKDPLGGDSQRVRDQQDGRVALGLQRRQSGRERRRRPPRPSGPVAPAATTSTERARVCRDARSGGADRPSVPVHRRAASRRRSSSRIAASSTGTAWSQPQT